MIVAGRKGMEHHENVEEEDDGYFLEIKEREDGGNSCSSIFVLECPDGSYIPLYSIIKPPTIQLSVMAALKVDYQPKVDAIKSLFIESGRKEVRDLITSQLTTNNHVEGEVVKQATTQLDAITVSFQSPILSSCKAASVELPQKMDGDNQQVAKVSAKKNDFDDDASILRKALTSKRPLKEVAAEFTGKHWNSHRITAPMSIFGYKRKKESGDASSKQRKVSDEGRECSDLYSDAAVIHTTKLMSPFPVFGISASLPSLKIHEPIPSRMLPPIQGVPYVGKPQMPKPPRPTETIAESIITSLSAKCTSNFCCICGLSCNSNENLENHFKHEHIRLFEQLQTSQLHCPCISCQTPVRDHHLHPISGMYPNLQQKNHSYFDTVGFPILQKATITPWDGESTNLDMAQPLNLSMNRNRKNKGQSSFEEEMQNETSP